MPVRGIFCFCVFGRVLFGIITDFGTVYLLFEKADDTTEVVSFWKRFDLGCITVAGEGPRENFGVGTIDLRKAAADVATATAFEREWVLVGIFDGSCVGIFDGGCVGIFDGGCVGIFDGSNVGIAVGFSTSFCHLMHCTRTSGM
jgi:hypothetical protein